VDPAVQPEEGSGSATLKDSDGLTYRLLKAEEWEKLKGLAENDGWIPNPQVSAIVIAEDDDDKIVGFLVAQLAVHVEPLWVAPSSRGGVTMARLWHEMQGHLREQGVKAFFSHASNEEIGSYLERLGLQKISFIPYMGGL